MNHINANIFSEKEIFFVLYAPAFKRTSGGIYAMHALAEDMYAMGCNVGMLAASGMPGARVPIITLENLESVRASGIMIVAIYPEIVTSNVLQADYCVWWLLNYPGFLKKNWDGNFDWADRIVCFGPEVGRDCRCDGKLIYPLYDPDLFFPNNAVPQTEITYYSHRIMGISEPIAPPVEPTVILSPTQNLSYKQLRKVFWKSKVVITHEWSGTLVIAQLCGTPVIFIESPILSRDLHHGELFMYGSAWGYSEENILTAAKTLNSVTLIHKDRKTLWHRDLLDEVNIWISELKKK